ncbi:MAG: beta-propeller fold lactonase family protein [Gammaproteobacteria bacterium]|nr:beta-propeller fold lactonase family protein [Gammaproteobacteria bacterium]
MRTILSKTLIDITAAISVMLGLLVAGNVSAATEKLFVAAEGTDNIAVIDVATNTVITTISTGAGSTPHNPVLSPDNNYVYVTLKGTGEIAKINVNTNTLTAVFSTGGGLAPVHMDVSADGNWLYVVNQVSDQVVKMSAVDGSIDASYTFGGAPSLTYKPHDINVGPNGNIWITDEEANTLSIMDTSLTGVFSTVGVGDRPIQVVFGLDGNTAYTTNFNDNTVSVIDVADALLGSTVPGSFDMGGVGSMGPMGAVIDPDGGTLWLSGTAGNTVHGHSLIDGDNYSYTATNNLIAAHGLDISDDGTYLFTSIFYDGSSTSRDAVAVIDADTGLLVTKFYIAGANDLHGLVYVSAVPVPAAVWLFGSGLLGLIGVAKRKKV